MAAICIASLVALTSAMHQTLAPSAPAAELVEARLALLHEEQDRLMADDRGKLLALLQACRRVLAQLESIHPGSDNPFAQRIRETCRDVAVRLARLGGQKSESRSRQVT